jgi:cell division protein ZapB
LTTPGPPSTIAAMDEELTQLENRIEQLVSLHEAIKAENRDLRSRLARLEVDSRNQADKLKLATDKLEDLLARLPQD